MVRLKTPIDHSIEGIKRRWYWNEAYCNDYDVKDILIRDGGDITFPIASRTIGVSDGVSHASSTGHHLCAHIRIIGIADYAMHFQRRYSLQWAQIGIEYAFSTGDIFKLIPHRSIAELCHGRELLSRIIYRTAPHLTAALAVGRAMNRVMHAFTGDVTCSPPAPSL